MHRKNKKRTLNVLLVPDNESPPKSFQVRYVTLALGVTVLLILLVAGIWGLIIYSQVYQSNQNIAELKSKNLDLQERLKRVEFLENELKLMRVYKEKVQNSLQGYVTLVENVEGDELSPQSLIIEEPSKRSIFSSVPIRTPVQGFVSQEFDWPQHGGIDIVASEGTPINAAADGVVVLSSWTYEAGHIVILHHSNGYMTFYWHNSRNVVEPNQVVTQGDVIAFVGNSGVSTSGPHLHFEIWKDGQPLNPRRLLLDITTGEQ